MMFTPNPDFMRPANLSHSENVHGHDGPVQVSFPNFYYPVSGNWLEATVSSGISISGDPNNSTAQGVCSFRPQPTPQPDLAVIPPQSLQLGLAPPQLLHPHLPHRLESPLQRPNRHQHRIPSLNRRIKPYSSHDKRSLLATGTVHTPQIL